MTTRFDGGGWLDAKSDRGTCAVGSKGMDQAYAICHKHPIPGNTARLSQTGVNQVQQENWVDHPSIHACFACLLAAALPAALYYMLHLSLVWHALEGPTCLEGHRLGRLLERLAPRAAEGGEHHLSFREKRGLNVAPSLKNTHYPRQSGLRRCPTSLATPD